MAQWENDLTKTLNTFNSSHLEDVIDIAAMAINPAWGDQWPPQAKFLSLAKAMLPNHVAHLVNATDDRLDTIYLERLGLNIALYNQLLIAKAQLEPVDLEALIAQITDNDKKKLSKKRERPAQKQPKDDFDPGAFLESLKPTIQPPPPPRMLPMSTVPVAALNANVLDAYFSTHLNVQTRSFREPLARGGFIQLALDMGHDWAYIADRLGLQGKKPSSSASVQQARLLYNLIVKFGLSRLRYLQPADGHVMPQFAGGHIKALKRHIKGMSEDERAWWRNGIESPRMLQTTTLSGEPLSYVDPTWLLPENEK
jgi:hypothetical protein